jgi:phenylpropionate dioxygenase-like ring-hydroxylating dioxygenase large terminal subunit
MRRASNLLPSRAYWDAASCAEERRAIFDRCWIYVGLAGEFAASGAERDIAGTVVTIACGLAGWTAHEAASGRPVRIGTCGCFVFCCLAAEAEPLLDYLAPYAGTLGAISAGIDRPDATDSAVIAANWKVLVENTLEDYHVAAIHPDSFRPPLEPDWQRHMSYELGGRHTTQKWDLQDDAVARWARLDRRLGLLRYSTYTGYRHYFIFPNFYVSTVYGAMAVLHQVRPLSAERSILEWSICLPLKEPASPARRMIKEGVVPGLAADARRVVLEDVGIAEMAQLGRHYAPHPGVLCTREARIVDFQESIVAAGAVPGVAPFEMSGD